MSRTVYPCRVEAGGQRQALGFRTWVQSDPGGTHHLGQLCEARKETAREQHVGHSSSLGGPPQPLHAATRGVREVDGRREDGLVLGDIQRSQLLCLEPLVLPPSVATC